MTYDLQCDLVTNALFYSEEIVEPDEISAILATVLGLRMEKDDIQAIIKRLTDQNIVLRVNGGHVISDESRATIMARIGSRKETESRALDKSIARVSSRWPKLTESELSALREDLLTFLNILFLRQGAESAKLLSDGILEDFDPNSILDSLPKRSESVQEIRRGVFLEFLGSGDSDAVRLCCV